jgi:hypothetical protein
LSTQAAIIQLKEQIENVLYPELRPYTSGDRDRPLREARQGPFDFLEWAGILAALVVAVGAALRGGGIKRARDLRAAVHAIVALVQSAETCDLRSTGICARAS